MSSPPTDGPDRGPKFVWECYRCGGRHGLTAGSRPHETLPYARVVAAVCKDSTACLERFVYSTLSDEERAEALALLDPRPIEEVALAA